MTAYLFYDTWIAALALLPALYVYLLYWRSRQFRKKEHTQHLLNNGSKRVAFIGGANHLDIVKRRKHGYLEALKTDQPPERTPATQRRRADTRDRVSANGTCAPARRGQEHHS